MTGSKTLSKKEILLSIANGTIGDVKTDKGGNYSPQHNIWVDHNLKSYLSKLSPDEQVAAEILSSVGLIIGRIFDSQLTHAEDGTMYPQKIQNPEKSKTYLETAKNNPGVIDAYSVVPDLNRPQIPYSHLYKKELSKLLDLLSRALSEDSPSVKKQSRYIKTLIKAYMYNPKRKSDLPIMREVDMEWVQIPSSTKLLFLAEPTEVYYDPIRSVFGQDDQIAKWAKQITSENKHAPWRRFFEFRLLIKDESMISEVEIQSIRQTSLKLFSGSKAKKVPASLEFRRLLVASGNGAFPAKTAKNYPNFLDIKKEIGYKNIIYTNMIEKGTLTHLIPSLKKVFGEQFASQINIEDFIRGSALRVVAHEENHPFRRHESNTAMEEFKSTINGLVSLIESDRFKPQDVKYAILSAIARGFYLSSIIKKARLEKDKNTLRSRKPYYVADTIMLNYLSSNNIFSTFKTFKKINYSKLSKAIINLSLELEEIRQNKKTIKHFYSQHLCEEIWDEFGVSRNDSNRTGFIVE